MSAPFDRVILGEVVTSDARIPHGYVAVRGETIAAIGEGAPPPATETIDHSGKLILPGVVSHATNVVEHPELVADRIERFAKLVGRESVIAGTDCGFATARAGDEVHPDVAWAKLEALSQGAEIASKRLW